MVGPGPALPPAWIEPVLRQTLASRTAHALLLQGPQGVGQFDLALALAQAWLCEGTGPSAAPCGVCASCRLVRSHSHPDLLVVLPPNMQEALGWGSGEADEAATERAAKAKPSKEIKVDAVRGIVSFAQTTSARGRGKVVAIHPADRMNVIAATTLLKTLEEPAGDVRFLLTCFAPDAMLATIRSRCQRIALQLPAALQATEWLAQQGISDAAVMLAAAGGQPQEALEWAQQGIDATLWLRLPRMVAQGNAAAFSTWPLPRVVDAMQKICHDAACIAAGGLPRYFPRMAMVGGADITALTDWMGELERTARHAEHPWNAGLMVESLVQQGRHALAGALPTKDSVHSSA